MDYETVFAILTTILSLIGIVVRESQNQKKIAAYEDGRQALLGVTKDVSDGLAYIFDRANSGQFCNVETGKTLAVIAGNIWDQWKTLGPDIEEIMDTKSSLAETLNPLAPTSPVANVTAEVTTESK